MNSVTVLFFGVVIEPLEYAESVVSVIESGVLVGFMRLLAGNCLV